MKTNGSLYVLVVVAVLGGYFTYQWWFNPQRAIKRQLGELAAALSVPPDRGGDMDRLARVARLRNYFAPDVHVRMSPSGPELTTRDALIGAVAAWTPSPLGWNVDFVDVQVTLDSDSTARAYLTVEVVIPDPASDQPTVDTREVIAELAKREGVWVITTVEPTAPPQRP